MENKGLILDYFIRCLQLTDAGEAIKTIELSEAQETATIIYWSGFKKPVNIACDSGIAMIRDIAKAIN